MAVDDMPEPAAEPTADDLDSAYQMGVDVGMEGFKWVRAALSVLTAHMDDDGDRMTADAIRDMRIASANRVARIMRLDVEPPGE